MATDTHRYNFDQVIDRRSTDSVKWACNERLFGDKDVISMWVADMDFGVPEPVIQAIRKRAEHGIYGYAMCSLSYCEAIINWMRKRHGWEIKQSWLAHSPGVVPALSMAVLAYTQPGDKIVIQSPVYRPFFSVVKNNGRQLVDNPLKFENNRYVMDLSDLEKQLDSRTKMLILCSPHNPVSRVWTRDELARLGEVCLKKNILIVSDEIHSDIVYPWAKHSPIASISEELAQNTITCIAPSKTFNLAGLNTSVAIIPNPRLLDLFNHMLENLGLGGGNVFGMVGLEAAYRYGEEWLDQLLVYLQGTLEFLTNYVSDHIPQINIVKPEGTYLVWLDCRALGLDRAALKDLMLKRARVALEDGAIFGPGGEGFQRMNIACPRSVLEEALQRIERAVKNL